MLNILCKYKIGNGRCKYIVELENNGLIAISKDDFTERFNQDIEDICPLRDITDISFINKSSMDWLKIKEKFIQVDLESIVISEDIPLEYNDIFIIEGKNKLKRLCREDIETEEIWGKDEEDGITQVEKEMSEKDKLIEKIKTEIVKKGVKNNTLDEELDNEEVLNIDFKEFKSNIKDSEQKEGFSLDCKKCKGTGKYIGEDGLEYICTCNNNKDVDVITKKQESEIKTISVNKGTKNNIVANGIIPKERINDEFSEEKCSELIVKSVPKGYAIRGFKKYVEQLNEIILACKLDGIKIDGSYIIGGDNGFGKTTFVNTCLKHLYNRGKRVVPYITLSSLAKLRAEEESNIREMIAHGYVKKYEKIEVDTDDYCEIIEKKYEWEDYMKASVLFCSLGGLPCMRLESEILAEILRIRGMRQLPTIVTTENSLNLYVNNKDLNESIWGNILNFDEKGRYDKLTHVSCYKRKKTNSDVIIGSNI